MSAVVKLDVSSELISQGLHSFLQHGLWIVGSDRSESEHVVRLLVAGDCVPAELHGRLVRATVSRKLDGLSVTTTLTFDPIT